MLVSFLLGFLIAYLLRSSKVRRLKKENKQMASDLQAAETQLASAQEQLKQPGTSGRKQGEGRPHGPRFNA